MKSMKIDLKRLIAYWLLLMPKNEFQAKSHQLIKCLESGCELKADNSCKIFLFESCANSNSTKSLNLVEPPCLRNK